METHLSPFDLYMSNWTFPGLVDLDGVEHQCFPGTLIGIT